MPKDTKSQSLAHLAFVRLSHGENPFPVILDSETTLHDKAELIAFIRQNQKSVEICHAYLVHTGNESLAAEL